MNKLSALRDIFYPNSIAKSMAIQTHALRQGITLSCNLKVNYLYFGHRLKTYSIFNLIPEIIDLESVLFSSIRLSLFSSDVLEVSSPTQTRTFTVPQFLQQQVNNFSFLTQNYYLLKLVGFSPLRLGYISKLNSSLISLMVNSHYQNSMNNLHVIPPTPESNAYLNCSIKISLFTGDYFTITPSMGSQKPYPAEGPFSSVELLDKLNEYSHAPFYTLKLVTPSPQRKEFINPQTIAQVVTTHYRQDLDDSRDLTKVIPFWKEVYGQEIATTLSKSPLPSRTLRKELSSPFAQDSSIETMLFSSYTILGVLYTLPFDERLGYIEQLQILHRQWKKRQTLLNQLLGSRITYLLESTLPYFWGRSQF